jgi:rRNA-processing protein FCF1
MNIEDVEQAIYEQTEEFVPQCVYKAVLNLIAAEREACADIVEDEIKRIKPIYSPAADIILRRIRERGQP